MEDLSKLSFKTGDVITQERMAIIDSNVDKYNANKSEILNTLESHSSQLNENTQQINNLNTNKASKIELNLSIKNNNGLAYDTFTLKNNAYNHFGLLYRFNSGMLLMAYREAPSHVGSVGGITTRKSYDGGKTWTDYNILVDKVDGIDIGGIGGLVLYNGRIIIIYNKRNLGTTGNGGSNPQISKGIFIKYSDDEGNTWSDEKEIISIDETTYLIYGKAIQLSNKIIQTYYAYTSTGNRVGTLISHDDGVTWSKGTDIYNGNENVTECALSSVGNVIIAIIRNENKTLKQIRSIDCGATWSILGDIVFQGEYPVSPFSQVVQNSNGKDFLILMYEDRNNKSNNTTTLKLRYADFQKLQSSSSIWSEPKNLLDTVNSNNGSSGYPSFVNDGYKIRFLVFDEIDSATTNIINKTCFLNDISDYDSGWTSINNATTINFNHNLGVAPRKIICLFAKNNSYYPYFYADNILKSFDTGIFYRADITNIYVSTGTVYCYAGFEGSTPPNLVQVSGGYVRVLAWQ